MVDTAEKDGLAAYERPNKSQIKREVQALLDLAKKLVDLNEEQWLELALPEAALEALQELSQMRQHGARKRQLKRVAKLLRGVNVALAMEAVEAKSLKHSESNLAFHHLERWRDRLLAEDQGAVTEFLVKQPAVDVQKLRQLVRNAKLELAKGKPPKSSRLLFKFIKDACASP